MKPHILHPGTGLARWAPPTRRRHIARAQRCPREARDVQTFHDTPLSMDASLR
jgi:hypothetical protein